VDIRTHSAGTSELLRLARARNILAILAGSLLVLATSGCQSVGSTSQQAPSNVSVQTETSVVTPSPTLSDADGAVFSNGPSAIATPSAPSASTDLAWDCPSGADAGTALGVAVSDPDGYGTVRGQMGAYCYYGWPDRQGISVTLGWVGPEDFPADGPPAGAKNETRALGAAAYYGSLGEGAVRVNVFTRQYFGFILWGPQFSESQLVAMAALVLKDAHWVPLTFGQGGTCDGGWLTPWCTGL
jgi:hypothetical protein